MRRFKFVGSSQQADEYFSPMPSVGSIYDIDAEIGGKTVKYWAEECTDTIRDEWEEVFEKEDSQQESYCVGSKDFMSVSIITYNGDKEINVNFSTNDLKYLKDFVNNLI